MKTCRKCEHVSLHDSTCQLLVGHFICGKCLRTSRDETCRKCRTVSDVQAYKLRMQDDVCLRSPFCPLSPIQLQRLETAQENNSPTQHTLF